MPELVEGPRVLGLGLGLFLLVLLWSAVFAIVLVCTRLSLVAGVALTSLAMAVTAILVAIPRKSPVFKDLGGGGGKGGKDDVDVDGGLPDVDEFRVYDTIVIWKIVLASAMLVFLAGGGLCFLCGHGSEGVYPQPVRRSATVKT